MTRTMKLEIFKTIVTCAEACKTSRTQSYNDFDTLHKYTFPSYLNTGNNGVKDLCLLMG